MNRFCTLAMIIFISSGIHSAAQTTQANDSTTKKIAKYKPKISGAVAMHYNAEFNTNGDSLVDPDGFRLFKARLEANGKISNKILYNIMIDLRHPEPGGLLRDAYIDLLFIKNQTIRIGRQKTQFGWENLESTTELYTVMRAEMSDAISRGWQLRDNGIGILGHIPISKNIRFEDAITFTNGTRFDVTGPYDFNTKKALWGRLGIRFKKDDLIIKLGGSFGTGGFRYLGEDAIDPADDLYVDFNRLGADVQVDHKHFYLAAEYGWATDHVKDSIMEDPFTGYQVLLAIKTKWKVGPLGKYDVSTLDDWKVTTVGAYYGLPKDKFRILVNYVFRGQITDIPGGHDDRLYIQMQVVF